jgi:hypothetical protein
MRCLLATFRDLGARRGVAFNDSMRSLLARRTAGLHKKDRYCGFLYGWRLRAISHGGPRFFRLRLRAIFHDNGNGFGFDL